MLLGAVGRGQHFQSRRFFTIPTSQPANIICLCYSIHVCFQNVRIIGVYVLASGVVMLLNRKVNISTFSNSAFSNRTPTEVLLAN